MSEDPYHTEFVSWRVDHFRFFIFFPPVGSDVTLQENWSTTDPSLSVLSRPPQWKKIKNKNDLRGMERILFDMGPLTLVRWPLYRALKV